MSKISFCSVVEEGAVEGFISECHHCDDINDSQTVFTIMSWINIRKKCPCNEYPLKPHFYIVKLGYAGVYLFFLFLLQNIDCGYSLEPPRRGGSNVYPQSMFRAKIRKLSKIFL